MRYMCERAGRTSPRAQGGKVGERRVRGYARVLVRWWGIGARQHTSVLAHHHTFADARRTTFCRLAGRGAAIMFSSRANETAARTNDLKKGWGCPTVLLYSG